MFYGEVNVASRRRVTCNMLNGDAQCPVSKQELTQAVANFSPLLNVEYTKYAPPFPDIPYTNYFTVCHSHKTSQTHGAVYRHPITIN